MHQVRLLELLKMVASDLFLRPKLTMIFHLLQMLTYNARPQTKMCLQESHSQNFECNVRIRSCSMRPLGPIVILVVFVIFAGKPADVLIAVMRRKIARNHQIAAANRSPTTVNAESLPGQQRRQRRRQWDVFGNVCLRRCVVDIIVITVDPWRQWRRRDTFGRLCRWRRVVNIRSSRHHHNRWQSRRLRVATLPPLETTTPPSPTGGGGGGFTSCCWSSGCFVAFVLDRAVLGETKLCQKWT